METKRLSISSILLMILTQLAFTQTAEITNITASQRTDGSGIVDICYDLQGDENFSVFSITAEISFDQGNAWNNITNANGDFGSNIEQGIAKCFVWNFSDEFGELYTPDAHLRIHADSAPLPPEPGDFDMVYIPGGTFTMGCTPAGDSDCGSHENPRHTVTLSPYSISSKEITNQQYADYLTSALVDGSISATSSSVTGTWNGNNYEYLDLDDSDCEITYSNGEFIVDSGKENHPVIEVSWYGATGFSEYNGGRLPTEAEWEYASRGGGQETKWSGTSNESELPDYAWYNVNSGSWTNPVGTKLPNSLGLYDMSGNVWEWVSDWYDSGYYSSSPQNDPEGPNSSSYRVLRGGYWLDNAYSLRCSLRSVYSPGGTFDGSGFRFVSTN